MTIYKSRHVSLDPEPWQWSTRPEWRTSDPTRVIKTAGGWVWAPRREQSDTPVNRILQAFVLGKPTKDIYAMLQILDSRWVEQFSREEEEHARAVFEGLIAWRLSA